MPDGPFDAAHGRAATPQKNAYSEPVASPTAESINSNGRAVMQANAMFVPMVLVIALISLLGW